MQKLKQIVNLYNILILKLKINYVSSILYKIIILFKQTFKDFKQNLHQLSDQNLIKSYLAQMLFNRTIKKDRFLSQSFNNAQNLSSTKTSKLNQLTEYQIKLLNYKQSLTKDINHPRIRQIILNYKNIDKLLSSSKSKMHFKQNFKNNLINLQFQEQRKWLTKKGKKYLIDFDDNQRKKMKDCFNAMDSQNCGSIGIDQLQQLLISVGLMQSRQEVKLLIDSVDQDKSGKIQFSQFLKMILNDEGENEQIVQFFKFIINSNRKKNQQQIQSKKSKEKFKERSNSQKSVSPQKKLTLMHEKQNLCLPYCIGISSFYQNRKKFYSSPDKNIQACKTNKNSALNIFQKHPHPKNLPFGMIVSHIRRKHMMTALKIGENTPLNLKKIDSINSAGSNKSNHYISNNFLRSSQNIKQSKSSSSISKHLYNDDDIQKGQSVMSALKKMWDRRLLRQFKQKKTKKDLNQKFLKSSMTQKHSNIKPSFPVLQ